MKFLLASLFVAAATAFSPNALSNARISNTAVFNQLDPKMQQHLEKYGEEASTAMFVNCDEEGCEIVEGVHEGNQWNFKSKGPAEGSTQSQMLGMSMEDTE